MQNSSYRLESQIQVHPQGTCFCSLSMGFFSRLATNFNIDEFDDHQEFLLFGDLPAPIL